MKKLLVPLIFLVALLTGCGGIAARNSAALNKLNLGDSKATVIALMGEPKLKEAYGKKEYWLYVTTGFASEDEDRFTPVVFTDGKVIGWGKKYFSEIRDRSLPSTGGSRSSGGGNLVIAAPLYNPPNMTPFMTNPSTAPVRGNTEPFLQTPPQQPIQNPSVNCNPNGAGGFKCQ
jgi:Protein of unknown function (DUF3192)